LLSLVILVVRAAMWRPSNTLSGSLRRSSITTTATGLIAGCLSRHDHESETVSALRAPSTSTTG
jgi:hypothetical protein